MAILFKSGSVARVATLIMACALLVACLALVMPRSVSAGPVLFTGPFIVDGHVTDSAGRPMAGVPVVVLMMNGTTPVHTWSSATDGDGFYTVTFDANTVAPGFNVTSTTSYNSVQVSQTVMVTDPFMTIDLQYPFEIPEFGTILGFVAAAGLVGVVAAVFLVKKSN